MDGRYTYEEKADMHLIYGAADGNARLAVRMYQEKFPTRQIPERRMFTRIHTRLRETGSFDTRRLDAGRPNHRNRHHNDMVIRHFEEQPTTSTRSAAKSLGLPNHLTVWRTLKDNRLHPFHFQKVQGLLEQDCAPRIQFCRWVLEKQLADEKFLENVLFTDEAYFTRDGLFNTHNFHIWQRQNPHAIHQNKHQYRFSVNVWAGIVHNQLIGPYILPSPLTGNVYKTFLKDVLSELLEDVPLNIRRMMWYQHDGVPAHFHTDVRRYLNDTFPNRWIGRHGSQSWPARSPDLTPIDFFLWGHMKSLVYDTPIDSAEDLVGRIVDAAALVSEEQEVFSSVRSSIVKRCQKCIDVGGHHFEQLL